MGGGTKTRAIPEHSSWQANHRRHSGSQRKACVSGVSAGGRPGGGRDSPPSSGRSPMIWPILLLKDCIISASPNLPQPSVNSATSDARGPHSDSKQKQEPTNTCMFGITNLSGSKQITWTQSRNVGEWKTSLFETKSQPLYNDLRNKTEWKTCLSAVDNWSDIKHRWKKHYTYTPRPHTNMSLRAKDGHYAWWYATGAKQYALFPHTDLSGNVSGLYDVMPGPHFQLYTTIKDLYTDSKGGYNPISVNSLSPSQLWQYKLPLTLNDPTSNFSGLHMISWHACTRRRRFEEATRKLKHKLTPDIRIKTTGVTPQWAHAEWDCGMKKVNIKREH